MIGEWKKHNFKSKIYCGFLPENMLKKPSFNDYVAGFFPSFVLYVLL